VTISHKYVREVATLTANRIHIYRDLMYGAHMKRLQILIEEDLDAALAQLAAAERTSKGALIRRLVAQHVRKLPPIEADPLWGMVGAYDARPGDVDEVVYGPRRGK